MNNGEQVEVIDCKFDESYIGEVGVIMDTLIKIPEEYDYAVKFEDKEDELFTEDEVRFLRNRDGIK